jgi:cytochrome c-type biogenesis protein CcmH
MRRALAALLALLALAPSAALAAERRASLPDIEDEVMCVTCNVPLNIAESPQAYRERELIRSLVDQGLTKAQIKDRLVAEYGSNVLALPESDDGIGLAAYLVPIAVVLALLAVGAVLLPRWRRRARLPTTPGAPAGAGATDLELRRLEDDLQRYDRR